MLQVTTLSNGLQVITERVDSVASISLGFWIKAGSRWEPVDRAGVAHFLEHTVFRGSRKYSAREISTLLENGGGALNAFTSREVTLYRARFLAEYLPLAVDLFTDMLQYPTLPPEDLEKERMIILQEMRDRLDLPVENLFDAFEAKLFPDSSLGRPVDGWENTVESITRDDLLEYLNEGYRPERTIVVATGKVEHESLVEMLTKAYDKPLPADGVPPVAEDLAPYDPQRLQLKGRTWRNLTVLGRRTFPVESEQRLVLDLLKIALTGGLSSRLFRRLRDESGLVYDVEFSTTYYHDTGMFDIFFSADPPQAQQALDLVLDELEKLRREPIGEEELQRVKAQYRAGVLIGAESMNVRMERHGQHAVYFGTPYPQDEILAKVEHLTASDLQRLAQELFDPSAFLIASLEPGPAELQETMEA